MTARKSVIPIFVPHLGCPNACVFCNQKRISGNEKPSEASDVHSCIKKARDKLPPGTKAELAFYGGSFTAIPLGRQKDLLEAAREYADEGFISEIRLSTRPDAIDDERLEFLKRYPVKTIELGAQSMDAQVLRLSGRGHSPEDTERASGLIKKYGFRLILQMMTGLPGDSPEKSVYTARKLAALKPDGVRIYPTVVIKDTALYEMWRSGIYREHSVEEAKELCAELFLIFEAEKIPVIRLGLNPTDELSGGDAVAGAYHPAFGELVYSEIMLRRAKELLRRANAGKRIILGVHSSRVSAMAGHKRCNIKKLSEEFGLESIRIKSVDTDPGSIVLL